MRRGLLRDRRGISSAAVAALLSIAVLLVYVRALSSPHGSEEAFFTAFGFLKWLAESLGAKDLFVEFEGLIKDLQGTPFWALAVTMLACSLMGFSTWVTYYGTRVTVGATTRLWAWAGGVRARKQREREVSAKSGIDLDKATARKLRGFKLPKMTTKGLRSRGTKEEPSWRRLSRTEWWDFNENQLITLKEDMLSLLILEAKRLHPTKLAPAGSITRLAERSGIDSSILCRAMNQEDYAMTVKNLQKILNTLKFPYRELTPYIKSIGGGGFRESITNPKLPFDLYNNDGATLIAAGLKDGHVRKDRTSFEYINYNDENVQRIIESVKSVFGNVNYQIRYDDKGSQKGVLFHSETIGLALYRAGVPKGRKTAQDYQLSDVIKFGDFVMKNKYFKQAMRDEGDIDYRIYRVRMTNAKEIHSKVMPEHINLFEKQKWKTRTYPSGRKEPYIRLTKKLEYNIPIESRPIYQDFLHRMKKEWIPPILNDERKLLEETYGVKVDIVPKDIYKGKKVGLSGSWDLVVGGKKNFEKFVRLLDLYNKDKGDES